MKTPIIMIAMLSLSAPALAGGDMPVKTSTEVAYQDLSLATAQGQKKLSDRIDIAARRVCKLDNSITGTRIRDRDAERCYVAAKERANQQFAAVVEQHAKGG